MSMDKETATRVARLARIKMSDEELENIAPQLSHILQWIEQLGEVDTDNVEPQPSSVDILLKMREDIVNDGNCQEAVLANAPEELEGFYVVPKVVE